MNIKGKLLQNYHYFFLHIQRWASHDLKCNEYKVSLNMRVKVDQVSGQTTAYVLLSSCAQTNTRRHKQTHTRIFEREPIEKTLKVTRGSLFPFSSLSLALTFLQRCPVFTACQHMLCPEPSVSVIHHSYPESPPSH